MPKSDLYVGPVQYERLLKAVSYYQRFYYSFANVPWAVSEDAMKITRPPWAGDAIMSYIAGGQTLCPVASAEQSFLQLALNVPEDRKRISGAWVALTPCFRNEPALDDQHQPYFMKVELIDFDSTEESDVHDMVQLAVNFFSEYLTVDVVENREPEAGNHAFDIVSRRGRVELGSYGVREHAKIGKWTYGTGAAEPRLSYAIGFEQARQEAQAANRSSVAAGSASRFETD